jgi:hypothetical protein
MARHLHPRRHEEEREPGSAERRHHEDHQCRDPLDLSLRPADGGDEHAEAGRRRTERHADDDDPDRVPADRQCEGERAEREHHGELHHPDGEREQELAREDRAPRGRGEQQPAQGAELALAQQRPTARRETEEEHHDGRTRDGLADLPFAPRRSALRPDRAAGPA